MMQRAMLLASWITVSTLCGPSAHGASLSLRTLVYDVFLRPTYVSIDGQSERNQRLPEAIRILETNYGQLDVLVLTGNHIGALSEALLLGLEQDGWRYHSPQVGSSHERRATDGTIIVSRWPIVAQQSILMLTAFGKDRPDQYALHHARIEKIDTAGEAQPVNIFAVSLPHDDLYSDNFLEPEVEARQVLLWEQTDFLLQHGLLSKTPSILAGDFAESDDHTIAAIAKYWKLQLPPRASMPPLSTPQDNGIIGRRVNQAYRHGCLFNYRWRGVCSCCPPPDTLRVAWRVNEAFDAASVANVATAQSQAVPVVVEAFSIPWDRGTKVTRFLSDCDGLLTNFYFSTSKETP